MCAHEPLHRLSHAETKTSHMQIQPCKAHFCRSSIKAITGGLKAKSVRKKAQSFQEHSQGNSWPSSIFHHLKEPEENEDKKRNLVCLHLPLWSSRLPLERVFKSSGEITATVGSAASCRAAQMVHKKPTRKLPLPKSLFKQSLQCKWQYISVMFKRTSQQG